MFAHEKLLFMSTKCGAATATGNSNFDYQNELKLKMQDGRAHSMARRVSIGLCVIPWQRQMKTGHVSW